MMPVKHYKNCIKSTLRLLSGKTLVSPLRKGWFIISIKVQGIMTKTFSFYNTTKHKMINFH